MIIQKKRIRNILPYISHIPEDSQIIFGITSPERFLPTLKRVGFPEPLKIGDSILPRAVGKVSLYNAEGKEIVHKEQPMETAYRQAEWHWDEWAGRYETIKRSKIVEIPYQRYPRSFDPPPGIELTLSENSDGNSLLTSSTYKKTAANTEIIKHIVNIFLELFGECQFFTENLESIIKTPIKRLNWIILPQGEMPWERLKEKVTPLVESAPKGNRPVLYYRLETVNNLKPDFRAIGSGGFNGYIVHGFTTKKLYILESMYYGNATYIFDDTWEELSKMTKAEILNEKLQKDRVIHRSGWSKRIRGIISSQI